MPFTPEQLKAHRQRLRREGICPSCHRNEAPDGRATCLDCQDRINSKRKKRRRRYAATGRCADCGRDREGLTHWQCQGCNSDHTVYKKYGSTTKGRDEPW